MQERNAVDRMTSQDGIPLRMQWLVPVFHFPFGFHSFRYMIFISITGIAGKCTTPSFEALTYMSIVFWKFIKIFSPRFGGRDKKEKQKKSGNMGFKEFPRPLH